MFWNQTDVSGTQTSFTSLDLLSTECMTWHGKLSQAIQANICNQNSAMVNKNVLAEAGSWVAAGV